MRKIISCIPICFIFFWCSCSTKTESHVSTDTKTRKVTEECCNDSSAKKELICSLTSPELQERIATVLADLRKNVLEKKELETGYKFRFAGNDSTIDKITDFIKSERQCCAFLTFNLQIEDTKRSVWLSITGPEGSKDFIANEMGF